MRAHIEADASGLVVTGDDDLDARAVRRFFRAVLGASPIDTGWQVPLRGARSQDLVVRVDTFLRASGFQVSRGEMADRSVELALERQRGLDRSRAEAIAWRDGKSDVSESNIIDVLNAMGWREERTLRPHQLRNVAHAVAAINQANFSVPGAGKTVTALAAATLHFSAGTVDAVVVVGPLACFAPWESESAAALGDFWRTRRVRGTARQRRGIYVDAERGSLMLLSYATAAADRLALKALCERLNIMLVIDESHRIKRFSGGVWAPALIEVAELARIRMILSGTPMPNSARDLYSQLNVLWPRGLLTGSRTVFSARVDQGFGRVLPRIQPFTIRTAKHELGLPGYSVVRHEPEMIGIQSEVYEMIVHRLRQQIEDASTWEEKLQTLRRARPVRLLQAASNPELLNHPDDFHRVASLATESMTLMERLARFVELEIPCKSSAAVDILRPLVGDGQKVVCWSNFIRNLDNFSQLVRGEFGVRVFQVDGRVPAADDPDRDRPEAEVVEDDTRERRIEEFLDYDDAAVLVANPATCSESISLHRACRHAIYLDRTYDAALYLQSIDRVHRLGLPPDAEVTIHLLLALHDGAPSIDHLVDESLLAKQAAMEELLGGAELRPMDQQLSDAEGVAEDLRTLMRYLLGEETQADDLEEE